MLAGLDGIDAGLIVEDFHDRVRPHIPITLRCGDGRLGYYDFVLRYENAEISRPDEWIVAHLARTTDGNRADIDPAYHKLHMTADCRV